MEVIIASGTNNIDPQAGSIGKLRPLLITGLLCVGGRPINSFLIAEIKHPIISLEITLLRTC